MKLPPESSSPSPQDQDAELPNAPDASATFEQEFEQEVQELERSLQSLKERYTQIQDDQSRQNNLQQRLNQVQRDLRRTRSPEMRQELQAELKQIRQQLDALEVALESRLLSWNSLKDVFWQAVRFGGLGVVVGWILKSCTN
jgi:chromosome segregation ATPase